MLKYTTITLAMFVCFGSVTAKAEVPVLKSGTPVVYLADNLDEKDKLGWCIDTVGRGFAEKLHAHSCKPAGQEAKDTQFSFHAETGQLRSVPFQGKCVTVSDQDNKKKPFGLLDCVSGKPSQKFVYDETSMEIRIGSTPSNCVIVATKGRTAGPFMSRDLIYADCKSVDQKYKQWVVKN